MSCHILQATQYLKGRNSTDIRSPCVPMGYQRLRLVPGYPVQLTCAGYGRKHPALPVLHLLTAMFLPAPQDVHAANPGHGTDAIPIIVVPSAQKYTLVIIAVDLQPTEHHGRQSLGQDGSRSGGVGIEQGIEVRSP